MKLKEAATKLEDGIEETFTYMDFPMNTPRGYQMGGIFIDRSRHVACVALMMNCRPDR